MKGISVDYMAPISFRIESDEGRIAEFVPTHAMPLSVADLRLLDRDERASLKMKFGADELIVDGETHSGPFDIKANAIFDENVSVYALVPGGWLPMPFTVPPHFLVDRNVVIALRKIQDGRSSLNSRSLEWWARLFVGGDGLFSPLLYAFEAGFRRKPSMPEFIEAYEEGVSELRDALPGSDVVRLNDAGYRIAYTQLEAFDARYEKEARFLQAICPIITQRASRRSEKELVANIFEMVGKCDLSRASIVVLAALSCVYEDMHGSPVSIGRGLLKPNKIYTEADAFNAISDVRHMELAATNQGFFGGRAFSLCTCDRSLALMWSALSLREMSPSGQEMSFTFDITNELFSRLDEKGLAELKRQFDV